MTRKLTATTGVLLALVFAGCGKDDASSTSAKSTATAPAATTPAATTTSGAKASKSAAKKKKQASGSGSTAGSTGKKSSGSKSSGSTTTTTTKKAATPKPAKKKPVGVTPGSGSGGGADPSSGTGSGPSEERLAVVSVLRRYYKAFLDRDGATACSLLTSDGQGIMVKDGGAKTCADSVVRLIRQAGAGNLKLLETTRDGLHVNDITITGNNATAQIGKTSRLHLVQVGGRWLLRSPNVANGG
ncbi:MAG: hypothetical protein QOD69_2112 [Solirubrobacteraceae bacterium]|nr:hypothetical protein [Solirubrobacteraceae bacterium]